jgi:hypothetical protein
MMHVLTVKLPGHSLSQNFGEERSVGKVYSGIEVGMNEERDKKADKIGNSSAG